MHAKQKSFFLLLFFLFFNLTSFSVPQWLKNCKKEFPELYSAYTGTQCYRASLELEEGKELTWQQEALQSNRVILNQIFREQERRSRQAWQNTPPPQACAYMIRNKPYSYQVYQKVYNVHELIEHVNDNHLPTRIEARLKLLEYDLPPPYHKKFQKALREFKKAATDKNGNLREDLSTIPENIFKDILKRASKDVRKFYADLHSIEKNYTHQSPHISRGQSASKALELIESQHKWNDFDFAQKQSSYNKTPLLKKLYSFFINERLHKQEIQEKIKHDSLWQNATSAQRSDPGFQSQLLLRCLYHKGLKNSNSFKENIPKKGSLNSSNRKSQWIVNFSCVGIDNCPKGFKQFFHESGVLKEHMQDAYTRHCFENHKLTSPQLHYALNHALIMRKRNINPSINEACYQIENCIKMALEAKDPKIAKLHENHALKLQNKIKSRKTPPLTFSETSKAHRDEFAHLDLNKHINPARHAAQQQTIEDDFREYPVIYPIGPEAKGFMQSHGLNPYLYTHVTGNGFQHELTEEALEIIKRAAIASDPFIENLADYIGLAQSYNRIKEYGKAVLSTDICWDFLHYAEALPLGLAQGINGLAKMAHGAIMTIDKALDDPRPFLISAAKGIVKLVELGIQAGITDADSVYDQLKEAGKQALIKLQCSSGPQIATGCAKLLTEQILMAKALTVAKTACADIISCAKDYSFIEVYDHNGKLLRCFFSKTERVAPAGLPAESSALLAKETSNKVKDATKAIIASTSKNSKKIGATPAKNVIKATTFKKTLQQVQLYESSLEARETTLIETNNSISKLSNKWKKVNKAYDKLKPLQELERSIPRCHENYAAIQKINEIEKCKVRYFLGKSEEVELNMMHEYAIRAKMFNNNVGIEGFHYYQGTIEELLKEFNNKYMTSRVFARRGEYYDIRISINGREEFVKTVHVTQSSVEEAFAGMMEAFADTRKEMLVENSTFRYRTVGYTKDNARIIFLIDKKPNCKARIVTFYACEEWARGKFSEKTYSPDA